VSLNDEFVDHRINVAITRINKIIKLIFKNSKDSVAITAGSGGSIIVPNRVPGEDQRFMELSKIIKLMQMQIPKKFDSKA